LPIIMRDVDKRAIVIALPSSSLIFVLHWCAHCLAGQDDLDH
jgi:hypothetical protein